MPYTISRRLLAHAGCSLGVVLLGNEGLKRMIGQGGNTSASRTLS